MGGLGTPQTPPPQQGTRPGDAPPMPPQGRRGGMPRTDWEPGGGQLATRTPGRGEASQTPE
eukprot:2682763-Alexandrium_andersonii.AAC.1